MYAKRKGIIEPIFGQLKQVLGFRPFSMRVWRRSRRRIRRLILHGPQFAEADDVLR